MKLFLNCFTFLAFHALSHIASARSSSSRSSKLQHNNDLPPRNDCEYDIADSSCGFGSAICFTGPNTISQSDLVSAIETACYGNLSAKSTAGQWLNHTQQLPNNPNLSVWLAALNIGPKNSHIIPEHCVRWFSDLESYKGYCSAPGSSTQGGILRLSFPDGYGGRTKLALVLAIQGNDNDLSTLPGQNGCEADWTNPDWMAIEEALQELSAFDSLIFPPIERICH